MADRLSGEDCARELLDVFKQYNCKEDEMLMMNTFVGKQMHDFKTGLEYAMQEGWVEIKKETMIFLTSKGFDEM